MRSTAPRWRPTRPGAQAFLAVLAAYVLVPFSVATSDDRSVDAVGSFLETHLLVTWYGNPHSAAMGVLGQRSGEERADTLRRQAGAYAPLTSKYVVAAYQFTLGMRPDKDDTGWSSPEQSCSTDRTTTCSHRRR